MNYRFCNIYGTQLVLEIKEEQKKAFLYAPCTASISLIVDAKKTTKKAIIDRCKLLKQAGYDVQTNTSYIF